MIATRASVHELSGHDVAAAPPQGRLWRYALYQIKDFALQRGTAMLAIALAFAFPMIASDREWAQASVFGVMMPVIVFGAILSVRGIAADDRQHGYYRFAFAKPVSVTRYYAQAYVLHFAGYLALVGLLLLFFATVLGDADQTLRLLAASAVFFTLVGGLGFLLSTLVRTDWFWLVVTLGASGAVNALYRTGTRWLAPLVLVLPPVEALGRVMESFFTDGIPMRLGSLAWVLGYGAACTVAALAVIRRRAFA